MGLDIRIPIGLMFTIMGSILTTFGAFSDRAIYMRSLGFNINLIWGLVLLVCGVLTLLAARRANRKASAKLSLPLPMEAKTREKIVSQLH